MLTIFSVPTQARSRARWGAGLQ